ncbi:hypothetical protein NT6N_15930 [Oceaniferula spumae]|uniref:Ice-binding protein C-terminal domain-containing protein n=1 Tax=Oceaniferula spumae TaxID=2979115 RepID=A0AAT9FKT2_9BACT
MKKTNTILLLSAALASYASAALTLQHYYGFESSGVGTDSVAGQDFTVTGITSTTGGVYGNYGAVSNAAGNNATGADWSTTLGANTTTSGTSYAIGFYVRSAGNNGTSNFTLNTHSTGQSLVFTISSSAGGATNGDVYAATINGQFWIGNYNGNNEAASPGGNNTPILVDPNQWQQLVVISDERVGVNTHRYFIDGTFIGQTASEAGTTFGNASIGAGTAPFDMDDLRVYSYDPANDSEADVLNAFATAVPEPSSTALIGLAGLAFILRRRR